MPSSAADLCEKLAAGDANLRTMLDGHIRDNDELLAHVFFGDVTRYYESLCNADRREEAVRIVNCIDEALAEASHEDYVDNVIHVSFLECLPWRTRSGLPWELLTPRLKAGYDVMHGYSDPS